MSYVSIAFLIFCIAVFCVYYLCPHKYQWIVLLAASYVFYFAASVKYAGYLVFSTLCTYGTAIWIEKIHINCKEKLKENKDVLSKDEKKEIKAQAKSKALRVLVLTLFVNFGILAFLKYYNFAAANFNRFFGFLGFTAPALSLILPLGISFYTFQATGYVIDVYREDIKAERNPAKFALFLSFFPQIIQGPIGRYDPLAHQLYEEHQLSWRNFKYGCELMLWGYFKKMVIADRFLSYVQIMMEKSNIVNGTALTITVVLYSIQLYADFSGGIDISRGIAGTLGIEMGQNFRQPFFAVSLSDFWNRWHISLGAWMKNYVFYPLALSGTAKKISKLIRSSKIGEREFGKNLASVLPGAIASLIVFTIVGLWHGAEWRYVLFGLYNGGIIMISTILKPYFEKLKLICHIGAHNQAFHIFQIIRTFVLVVISNITDIITGTGEFFVILKNMLTDQHIRSGLLQVYESLALTPTMIIACVFNISVLFVVDVIKEKNPETMLRMMIDKKHALLEWGLVLGCLLMIMLFGVYGPGYHAADFVYMQF